MCVSARTGDHVGAVARTGARARTVRYNCTPEFEGLFVPNISLVTALLADPAAMAKFLSPIPNSDQLAKVLGNGKPVSSRAYEDDAWTARFVSSDGVTVKCFTVANITIDQAELIAAVSADFGAWQEPEFRDMVNEVLAPTPDPPE